MGADGVAGQGDSPGVQGRGQLPPVTRPQGPGERGLLLGSVRSAARWLGARCARDSGGPPGRVPVPPGPRPQPGEEREGKVAGALPGEPEGRQEPGNPGGAPGGETPSTPPLPTAQFTYYLSCCALLVSYLRTVASSEISRGCTCFFSESLTVSAVWPRGAFRALWAVLRRRGPAPSCARRTAGLSAFAEESFPPSNGLGTFVVKKSIINVTGLFLDYQF